MEADIPNMVRGVTFPSHTWGIRPVAKHWMAGQSEHTTLFRTIGMFQKGGAEGSNNNVWYVESNAFFVAF